MGINTVLDLACTEAREMQRHFLLSWPVQLMNYKESHVLRSNTLPIKKQIVASRSFGGRVTELTDLKKLSLCMLKMLVRDCAMKGYSADV